MLAACEAGEVFALLESRDAADAVGALYAAVREPWLTRALLLYHARTGAARALDLLARAPEPHARHLLDALLEQMRGERVQRHHALAALAPLVARRPAWLHRLPAHPLAPALLRAARLERDPLPLLHALLTLAALLHAAPALAAPHWPDLADALLRPAALDPPPSPAARAHLQLAQLALFHALYATHPCTLLETLRGECAGPPARDWWERGLAPLLHSVRLHPALVTGSRQREADTTRWTRHDIHDVVAESRRLSIQPRDRTEERAASASCAPTPAPPPPPRRAASCSPRIPAARTAAVAVQTVDTWPAPYEFLIGDFYRSLTADARKRAETAPETVSPCERLDKYLADLYAGRPPRADSELAEQLALAHAQLLHERWRREAHAERNRRLLGRCRQARALELQNAALRDQLRAAHLERDELRARLRDTPALPAHAAAAAAAGEREAQLQAALADQTAARLRAEAALHEAEERRALDVAELQRTRGESFEAARHVEMLARTALAAERRAEHVRRLRRELLVLAEREARLSEAARAAIGVTSGAAAERNASEERALRAALARAEAEADANAARAEAAVARAHELETTLSARDAALAELRRALRHAGEEHAARQRALQDKYAALLCIVRTGESRKLELLAGEGGEGGGAARGGPRAGGAGGPLAARPALADCNRVRRLVCEEDEPALERS
ncbi:PREDICTED: hamartin-like [Papilio xuthus]|uniref:Hamartin-like n=1 Tax=Papilio xuthus TaxID=66420 RepID=A0AAJ6ZFD8_PAPXU|nr:PREDICTED: hamartin-like [Papilio xuthus]